MKSEYLDNVPKPRGCNVSSTFNFTVGALSVTVALVIAYLVYIY